MTSPIGARPAARKRRPTITALCALLNEERHQFLDQVMRHWLPKREPHRARARPVRGKLLLEGFILVGRGRLMWCFQNGLDVLRERPDVVVDRCELVFDTLGDSEPGGELIVQELTSVSGPHPRSTSGEGRHHLVVDELELVVH
jgi:hypothetical protein